MWPLTQAWYGDRLALDYRPAPIDLLQRLLTAVGATSDFWVLDASV